MARVLITRAQPEADATAALVEAMGFKTLVAPLTEIIPLEEGLAQVRNFETDSERVVVATSARTVQTLLDAKLDGFVASERWAVVGERAATLLKQVGADLVADPAPHIKGLFDILPADASLSYLCAQDRKPDLEDAFTFRSVIPVYQAQALGGFSRETAADLHTDGVTYGLIYSARGADLLFEALWYADLRYLLPITKWFCLSREVSKAFRGRSQHSINCVVPKLPTQDALLAMLAQSKTS